MSRTSYIEGGKGYWEAYRGTMGAFIMITMYFQKSEIGANNKVVQVSLVEEKCS